ncbi:MAG: AMP-binding protein [Clostridia bacterium]
MNNSMYAFIKEGITDLNQTKICYYNRKITAKEMLTDIDKVATFLVQNGICKGDKVAICLPNIPQAIIALYAINKIGAVANVLHPKLKGTSLINALKTTNTKMIFLFAKFLNSNKKVLIDNGIVIVNCKLSDYFIGTKKIVLLFENNYNSKMVIPYKKTLANIQDIKVNINGNDDAVLLHSSGTFGESKIVRLSSTAFNSLVINIMDMVEKNHKTSADDSMLMILPIFHGFGLGICVHLPMYKFQSILIPNFKPKKVASQGKKTPINMMAGVPSMYKKLLNEPKFDNKNLQNMKLLFCGGDTLPSNVKLEFDELLAKNNSKAKLMEGYGLSEVSSVVSINLDGIDNGSQGQALPNVNIVITDENNNILPTGKIGEICVCSPSVMNGYFDLTEVEKVIFDNKEYIKTGDYGYLDSDKFVYYKDRKKRIILIGGINIYPQEVECLIATLAEVKNCAVIREYLPKPHTKVYLELEKNIVLNNNLKNKISVLVSDNIIRYAVPKEFEVVNKIKLNSIGKVDFKFYEDKDNQ